MILRLFLWLTFFIILLSFIKDRFHTADLLHYPAQDLRRSCAHFLFPATTGREIGHSGQTTTDVLETANFFENVIFARIFY